MGRPKKPTAIKAIEGNRGRRALNTNEPKPKGEPEAPSSLSKAAKPIWDRYVASMTSGVWSTADEGLLQAYCEHVALMRLAVKMMEKDGHIVKGSTGQEVLSPWHKIFTDSSAKITSIGARLGLDPAARQSLNAAKPTEEEEDEFGIPKADTEGKSIRH